MKCIFNLVLLLLIVTTAGQGWPRAAQEHSGRSDLARTGNRSAGMRGSVRIVGLGDSITNGAGLAGVQESAGLWESNLINENSVSSVKDAVIHIIRRQPEDSTYDEILRELAYARMVQRGLDDGDAGRTLADSDVRRKIESWQK